MTHLIVDGQNMLYRAFFVSQMQDKRGRRTSGIFGMMKMLPVIMRKFSPSNVIVVWDQGKSKARLQLYPEYKKQRDEKRKPEDVEALQFQREVCQEIFSQLPVKQLKVQDVEADDIIGYLTEKLKGKKVVVSNDQDFFQLVKDDTTLFLPNKPLRVTLDNVDSVLGFPAKHYILWKSLVGDTSDNIKGVRGIGPKRATAIILNGVGGGKKLPIAPAEMEIIQRNKELIAIGALLQPDEIKSIHRLYKSEQAKAFDFQKVKMRFGRHDFDSLYHGFNMWRHPFDQLIRKKKK